MAKRPEPDDDDDFNDIYKEYTGPLGSTAANTQEMTKSSRKSHASSDEEEEPCDPNAVPTDFTSREAKVWEAKSKATERNWKKRKEEEMICKICGESGHFTQGCPSTLGANRKSQDFFERVAARDKHVRALFPAKVIEKIEKDVGCKIKMDEKFIVVSGKDRLILAKGVNAVHKIINEGGGRKGSPGSQEARSRSRSPAKFGRSDSQKSVSSPQSSSRYQQRFGRHEKRVENRIRDDISKFTRGSPQACGIDGARGRSSHSKSPARHPYTSNPYNSYDCHREDTGVYRIDGWDNEKRGSNMQSGHKLEHRRLPETLEDLELQYKKDAMDLGRIRDKEEDEENYKHRESLREIRENYMKNLAIMRGKHTKQWDDFLQFDTQRRQQQAYQHISSSGFGNYKHSPAYSEFDCSSASGHFAAGGGMPMDSRAGYPLPMDTYPGSRSHETYGEFQCLRRDDIGKAYNRY